MMTGDLISKPEIYPRCHCGWECYIGEGDDEGYCFNPNCYGIVRRPTPDQSGEADKTGTGLAEGESGLPEGSSK